MRTSFLSWNFISVYPRRDRPSAAVSLQKRSRLHIPVFCRWATAFALLFLLSSSCVLTPVRELSSAGAVPVPGTAAKAGTGKTVSKIRAVSWPASGKMPSPVSLPHLDGKNMRSNDAAAVDLSYTSYGFVKIRLCTPLSKAIKVIVSRGKTQYIYDLKNNGSAECYPLQMGNGSYTISVYSNISGDQYAQLFTTTAGVKLKNANIVYQVPSQYVGYNSNSWAAQIARRLVHGKTNNYERISAVLSYVAKTISYDYHLAKTVKSGYVPNINSVLSRRKGICFDYAAVSAAMLRSLGYPCRLVIGYVNGNVYHAWNEVYLSGHGWVKVMAAKLNTRNWSRVDVTFISSSHSSASITKFIGKGSNYKKMLVY